MEEEDKGEAQRKKIEEEKSALTRQLVCLVFASFIICAAFYGLTILQNPNLHPNDS